MKYEAIRDGAKPPTYVELNAIQIWKYLLDPKDQVEVDNATKASLAAASPAVVAAVAAAAVAEAPKPKAKKAKKDTEGDGDDAVFAELLR